MTTRLLAFIGPLLLAGCDDLRVQLPTPDTRTPPITIGGRFDPATAGNVTGFVTWVGDRPSVPPLRVCRHTQTGPQWLDVANPSAPRIGPAGELAGAVVFLRGIDPAAAAPWHHPPVVVEADDEAITAHPGGRVGFVPVGGEVEFRSASDGLPGVRGRGAAYFTHLLPDRAAVRRRFDRPGRVELTSPANAYWAAADLFVCAHPYYARTDDRGRFRFENVPPGEYEAVCWVPGWNIISSERDPETGAVFRAKYAPPAAVVARVLLAPGRTSDVRLDVSTSSFP